MGSISNTTSAAPLVKNQEVLHEDIISITCIHVEFLNPCANCTIRKYYCFIASAHKQDPGSELKIGNEYLNSGEKINSI